MSEALFDSAANQPRIKSIVTGLAAVIFNPVVGEVIHTPGGRKPGLGWGRAEYRSGQACLSNTPSYIGEAPAEIAFYPDLPRLGIDGAIYWHGEGSNALARGEVVGLYLDTTLVDGKYTNYLAVRRRASQLELGHPNSTDALIPPAEALVQQVEAKITDLITYVTDLN